MVLYNVTKFHKILIKTIRLGERISLVCRTDVCTDGGTGVTLNTPSVAMGGGPKNRFKKDKTKICRLQQL